jgi:L-methionine (R)-S-oxide reductase
MRSTRQTRQIQIVPDVYAFPGHIARSGTMLSEVVVPILRGAGAVLDIDLHAAVNGTDREHLEAPCGSLGSRFGGRA